MLTMITKSCGYEYSETLYIISLDFIQTSNSYLLETHGLYQFHISISSLNKCLKVIREKINIRHVFCIQKLHPKLIFIRPGFFVYG